MKKLIRRIIIGVAALIVIAVVVALLLINPLAKAGVERGAGYALGVDTRVEKMDVRLFRGEVTMTGLRAANPEGYESPHFIDTGTFDMQLRGGTVLSDTVELGRFVLDRVDLHVEQKLTGSNVGAILKNLRRFRKPETAEPKKPGKRVKIDRVEIRNVVAHFHLLGRDPVTVKVPAITLNDVTTGEGNGVPVSELVARLVPAVLAAVLEDGRGVLPPGFTTDLTGDLQATAATLNDRGAALIAQAGGELGQRIEKTVEGLGGGEGTTRPLGGLDRLLRPREEESE